jgi:acyl-CoA synthetase (AMP-forming)/AMP-acid ligase II/acyl carrier protein
MPTGDRTRLSVRRLLQEAVDRDGDAVALYAPDRSPLTYRRLLGRVDTVANALARAGVEPGDAVAVVVPNGPDMALACLGAASYAACAPLNPTYRRQELDFFLGDLAARAVVVSVELESPVRDAARALGVPLVELNAASSGEAGAFDLSIESDSSPPARHGTGDATALLLHTSGTTSRPKLVPLTHTNLVTSAGNIGETLAITPEDRCLNVMPLFHIHGLVAALLASLAAGAGVVCTPGFYASRFYDWLDGFEPTWYTAVPTMHQAVLARAPDHPNEIGRHHLRFVRSSSAPLPRQVIAELVDTFGVPVVEAYGMTEASHQITSNALDRQKPGSVGRPQGPDVAILDPAGHALSVGEVGEVAIRGKSVTPGYRNAEDSAAAFTDGWLRTGDLGYLDEDRFLYLTGRSKEMINRAGEKIAPREIDEVLLEHPDVAQAVAFAMPHESLGEEVAAAVVLRGGAAIGERDLQEFVATRLADHKIPRRVVFVDEIPKGPTGKLQRIGLADVLEIRTEAPARESTSLQAPASDHESVLADLWREVLRVAEIGPDDTFLQLGGDSMLAAQLIARIRDRWNVDVKMVDFFDAPTVGQMARTLDARLTDRER